MKVVTVWALKGGVGKSTVAVSIAAAAKGRGLRVLLVDNDHGQDSSHWLATSAGIDSVIGWPDDRPDGYDLIVVDNSPRAEEKPTGDVIVVPIEPAGLALRAVLPYLDTLREDGPVIEVTNKVDGRSRRALDNAKMRRLEGNAFTLRHREAYPTSQEEGTTIFDKRFTGNVSAREARKDIIRLLDRIYEEMGAA